MIFNEFDLKVGDGHTLRVQEAGTPGAQAVIYLHGGPGAYIESKCADFFDPSKYHVVLFDQRGCGKSRPHASIKANTTQHLVEDIERIREHFGWDEMIVFGGSFGSFLALMYAIAHAQQVRALVLRGIFLGRKEDVDWLFKEGANYFYPAEHERYLSELGGKNIAVVAEYSKLLNNADESIVRRAAAVWNDWENTVVTLQPQPNTAGDAGNLSTSRLECHYMLHDMFLPSDNYILENAHKIEHIRTFIVHGRYDINCRPIGAHLLAQRLKNCKLYYEICGHSAFEEANFKRLKEIMDTEF